MALRFVPAFDWEFLAKDTKRKSGSQRNNADTGWKVCTSFYFTSLLLLPNPRS
jgi:hypothetical protein